MSRRAIVVLAAFIFSSGRAVLCQQAPASVPPALSLAGGAVAVSGLAPGGQAVVFGVAREVRDGVSTVVRREAVLADDDGDGAVRLELPGEVPAASVWVAVDLGSGGLAIATPEGSPFAQVPLPIDGLRRSQADLPDLLEAESAYVEALLVRAGQGAWSLTAGNGGTGDEDGTSDDRIRSSLESMTPVGGSPDAPRKYAGGDLLVVVDPNRMEIAVARLEGEPR